ncbi:DUF4194 domain-containing protein [bacterium]|nr:DUF4194 domain-containing protein [bacterium]
MTDQPAELPEFRDWSLAAVRLLQGVVYHDDDAAWDRLLSNRSTLETYFGRLGLQLVIDEADGFAFLRQLSSEELPREYSGLPKLARSIPLSYGATLLCVLLREEMRQFEEHDVQNERCVVAAGDLFEQWKTCLPPDNDEGRLRQKFSTALRAMDDLKFARKVSDDPEEWEIRRIIKARVTAADLEALKTQFIQAARRSQNDQQSPG